MLKLTNNNKFICQTEVNSIFQDSITILSDKNNKCFELNFIEVNCQGKHIFFSSLDDLSSLLDQLLLSFDDPFIFHIDLFFSFQEFIHFHTSKEEMITYWKNKLEKI